MLSGERYKTITNEVKRYLQGGYGQPPAPVNEAVRKKPSAMKGFRRSDPRTAWRQSLPSYGQRSAISRNRMRMS